MKWRSDTKNHKNRDTSRKKEIIAICRGKCQISRFVAVNAKYRDSAPTATNFCPCLARTEVTWYGIGVYYWRCVVSRGTHVIARDDDKVFDIEWNYYTHAVEVNITYWENSDNLQYG